MKKRHKVFLTASGAVGAAVAGVAATTHYLCRTAMDRQEPDSLKKLQRLISGGRRSDSDFSVRRQTCAGQLRQRDREQATITAQDGVLLSGYWMPMENAERIIIAMHGWRSSWAKDFGMISDFWSDSGCSVLYAEQRGQGGSGGEYIGFGPVECVDCLDWIRWVSERCGDTLPVYLCGVSMGATTVLMAAGLPLPEQVHGIIADCGFTSPLAIWKHVARDNLHLPFPELLANSMYAAKTKKNAAAYSTTEALRSCRVPVMLIHGMDDHFVPVEMSYENYSACSAPKKLLVVPGAGHAMSYYTDRDRYEAAVLDFWHRYDGDGA